LTHQVITAKIWPKEKPVVCDQAEASQLLGRQDIDDQRPHVGHMSGRRCGERLGHPAPGQPAAPHPNRCIMTRPGQSPEPHGRTGTAAAGQHAHARDPQVDMDYPAVTELVADVATAVGRQVGLGYAHCLSRTRRHGVRGGTCHIGR
jgi:hypothetical protein